MSDVYKTDLNFEVTAKGDIDRISGLLNLKKALYHRLITTKGSLIGRPDYGVGIKNYLNAVNSQSTQRKLANAIQEEFEKDERVSKVLGVNIKKDISQPDVVSVSVRVLATVSGEELFNFSISEYGNI